MASLRWIGAALDVAQVDLITVTGTWAAADTATLTINSKDIVVTVGATVTVGAVATAIKEAINGDTITGDATQSDTGNNVPEFAELLATVNAGVVTVTARTKGKPFTLTVTESTAGSGTAVRTASVACTGKSFWDNVDNWDSGSLPIDADTVYIDHSAVSILYGLDQSAIELAALYIGMSFTGQIGLPETNDGGYHEYRSQYLSIGPAVLQIGDGSGTGSSRIKINSTSDVCALTVFNSGFSADDLPAILWNGTNASNTLVQLGGSLGIAMYGGEVATLSTVTKSGGDLVTGSGVTLSGALSHAGGSWTINSLIDTSLTQTVGATAIYGTGNVNQLTVQGGTVAYNTTGTLGGATVVSGNGVLDFGGSSVGIIVTNPIDLYGQTAQLLDPTKRLGSVVIDLNQGATLQQLDLGLNLRVTRGAVA